MRGLALLVDSWRWAAIHATSHPSAGQEWKSTQRDGWLMTWYITYGCARDKTAPYTLDLGFSLSLIIPPYRTWALAHKHLSLWRGVSTLQTAGSWAVKPLRPSFSQGGAWHSSLEAEAGCCWLSFRLASHPGSGQELRNTQRDGWLMKRQSACCVCCTLTASGEPGWKGVGPVADAAVAEQMEGLKSVGLEW